MLKGINKKLTGDLLKILCDMGHGDEIVFADANFPAETYGKRVLRYPGMDVSELLEAIGDLFPIDEDYSEYPALIMDLTYSDKAKGMATPEAWASYQSILQAKCTKNLELGKLGREEFYERTKNAYAVIQTGEERQYGNLILIKGVV